VIERAPTQISLLVARVAAMLRGPCGVADGTPLVLAVSGGADSVALAELVFLAGAWPIEAVVFVDHGLRDVAAEREAARLAADRLGRPLREVRLTLVDGPDLQARARLERYRALLSMAGPDALVATGHTRTDQAESVLMRVVRGTGVVGLGAMFPRHGRIVRPLLDVGRDETHALGLPFVSDPSNENDRFTRNRVRRHLLPQLRRENPRVEDALAALSRAARGTHELLTTLLERAAPTGFDATGLSAEAAEAYAHHLAHTAGASASRVAIETWARSLRNGETNKVSLGDGLVGRANHGRGQVESADDPRRHVVIVGPGTYSCAGMRLALTSSDTRPTEALDDLILVGDTLVWPLTLRPLHGVRVRGRDLSGVGGPGGTNALELLDATGRTLGLGAPGQRWSPRSPPTPDMTGITHWIIAGFQSSSGALQSDVVAIGGGPLLSQDAPGAGRATSQASAWADSRSRPDASDTTHTASDTGQPGPTTFPETPTNGEGLPEAGSAPIETGDIEPHQRSGR
jgi:tRNA(Ile)-lysidine synthase